MLLFGAGVATLPFYGYYVYAARDSQKIALLIFFCWILSWIFAIGSVILAAVRPPGSFVVRFSAIFLIAYLIIAGFIGWGGVRNAFYELIEGWFFPEMATVVSPKTGDWVMPWNQTNRKIAANSTDRLVESNPP